MAAVPEGESIYDAQGTILYRAIDPIDYEAELEQTQLEPSAAPSTERSGTMAIGGSSSMSAKYGPNSILVLGSTTTKSVRPARLHPLSDQAAHVTIIAPPSSAAATTRGTRSTAGAGAVAAGAPPLHHQQTAAPTVGSSSTATTSGKSAAAVMALHTLFPPVPLNADGDEINPEEQAPVPATGALREDSSEAPPHTTLSRAPPAEGMRWLRVASTEHLSRLDVVLLQQHLHDQCKIRQAKPRGTLCTVREQIYDDGLKELMRQITVLCPERGLLLDELSKGMAQSTDTYDALFDSACQYAVRKSTERDLRSYLFEEAKVLQSERRRCENRVNELRAKLEGMTKRFEDQQAATLKLHEEEVNYIKKCNQQIVTEIKRIVNLESTL